jgi:murein DD-endopeptidase MepM/ murein hydrolase activator NlpD
MRSSRTLPVKAELRGPQRVELCVLQPAAEGKWSFRSRYQWVPGTPGGRPDGALYRLPFAPGAGYRLIQGYRGDFSHQAGSADEHALDFQMPEGTPVLAARAGVVAAVRQDSTRGGRTRRFRNCANYVVVRHGDGTYAEYYHLRPNGARVKPGDPVAAGQLLGLSGNTGYSMLPHLHFAVYRPIDGQRRESLPVKFQSAGGKPLPLAEGRNY